MNLKYWLPVLLWVAFLFLMSTAMYSEQSTSSIIEPILRFFAPSISSGTIGLLHAVIRKLAHVSEYFIFGMMLFRAFRSGSDEPKMWRWALSSLMVLVLYAALDELHQSLVPERTGSVIDVMIDAGGGVLALCVSVFWFHRRHGRKSIA